MPPSRTCNAAARSEYVDLMPAPGAEKPPTQKRAQRAHYFAKDPVDFLALAPKEPPTCPVLRRTNLGCKSIYKSYVN
jgi:hypothetical protein